MIVDGVSINPSYHLMLSPERRIQSTPTFISPFPVETLPPTWRGWGVSHFLAEIQSRLYPKHFINFAIAKRILNNLSNEAME